MAKRDVLSPALLRQLIDYNPDTGLLHWRERTPELHAATGADTAKVGEWNHRHAGKECFTTDNGKGYRCGLLAGRMYRGHRVAWAIYHGKWPALFLDHINQQRADNRMVNLRETDFVENARNARMQRRNRSGQVGVHWDSGYRHWASRIVVHGNRITLGYFKSFDDAVKARKDAERQYGFSPLHGRRQ